MKELQPRAFVGVVLAVEWNMPLLLWIWYDLPTVLFVIGVNGVLWAGGILGFLFSATWRSWFFRSGTLQPEDTARTVAMAAWMLFLGVATVVMSHYYV